MISCITIPIVCTCTNQPQNYYIVYVTLVMVKYSQLHVYGHQPLCTLIYLLCTKKHNYLYCCNLLYIRKYSVCMRNNWWWQKLKAQYMWKYRKIYNICSPTRYTMWSQWISFNQLWSLALHVSDLIGPSSGAFCTSCIRRLWYAVILCVLLDTSSRYKVVGRTMSS